MSFYFVLVALLVSFFLAVSAQDVGDLCETFNNETGICKPFNQCEGAVKAIRSGISIKICDFEGTYPIVCCDTADSTVLSGKKAEKFCYDTYISSNKGKLLGVYNIHAGYDSREGEFPHMAALGFEDPDNRTVWGCGGSLISEKFVLTAAHCLNSKDLGNVKYVRMGVLSLNRNTENSNQQDFKIIKQIRHKNYKPPSKYHDIALLELDRPVRQSKYVKPACLQVRKQIASRYLIATGWGKLLFNGESADNLQSVDLLEITNTYCKNVYKDESPKKLSNGVVDDWQICAGKETGDTCQGDSGGPLQIKNIQFFEGYTVIGITSFGKACGISKSPGVYTRVSNYIDWIESIVWPN